MRIACVQTPAFALGQAPEAARYLLAAIGRAAAAEPRPDVILLPEVAYPAYYLPGVSSAADLDRRLKAMGAPTTGEFAAAVGERASVHDVHIAIGLALAGADGLLQNVMLLCDRQGRQTAQVGKQFLWHFDSRWFAPGAPPPVLAIEQVPAGLFICCDGRAPEIPRRLALAGAQLFLDATNWVTTGPSPKQLPNAQPDYMMRVRALENSCWFAAANKVGREADSIVYCGKSCVIAPDGVVLAMAASDQPDILVVDIPEGPGGLQGAGGGGLVPRRTGEYQRLAPGFAAPPAPAGHAPAPYVAVIQVADDDPALASLLHDVAIHGATVAVLPEGERPLAYWQSVSAESDLLLVATGCAGAQRVAWLLQRGELLGAYAKGHLAATEVAAGFRPGPAEPPVFATSAGRIGIMIGEDGLLPEVARGLALAGADLIAWPHRLTASWMEAFVRTRAAESRVFVAAAGRAEPGGEAMVVDPGGVPLARTFAGARQAVATYCFLALARHKELVPGTLALSTPHYAELI